MAQDTPGREHEEDFRESDSAASLQIRKNAYLAKLKVCNIQNLMAEKATKKIQSGALLVYPVPPLCSWRMLQHLQQVLL